jgi:hypothetical protein
MAQGKETPWDPFIGSGCFQALVFWIGLGFSFFSFLFFVLK